MKEAQVDDLKEPGLIVIGSATRAFNAGPGTQAFLSKIPGDGLSRKQVAAFDTRIGPENIKPAVLRFLVKTGGYAAPKIAKKLRKKGGTLITEPEGFCVLDKEGPLKDGELDRARAWGAQFKNLIRESLSESAG